MDEENITLNEMEEIFDVSDKELLESIAILLQEAKSDTKLHDRLIERGDIIFGKLSINRNNQGIVNFGDKKYHINSEDIRDGLNEDLVILEVLDEDKKKARVKKVAERHSGMIAVNYINNELIPVHAPFSNKIILNDEDMKKIEDKDRLLIKVDVTAGDETYCHLEQVIGKKDDLALEEKTIAVKNGFHIKFPSAVEKELENLPKDDLRKEDYIGKVDLRGEKAFTIDDETTQDIDDGLFIIEKENGNTIVGVPISLVTKFVDVNSAIFREACERTTSLYLGNHSEPMFPRQICNHIGSLNEGKDRLARTHLIEFDKDYNIVSYRNVQSVIQSRKQMTYYDVNNIITRDIVKDDYVPFVKELRKLYEISLALEKRKLERGATNFKSQEIKKTFDNRYQAIGFHNLEYLEARKIIENFALLTNELTAGYAQDNGIKLVNRVELPPDTEKFNQMIRVINACGEIDVKEIEDAQNPMEIARVIDTIQNSDRFDAFSAQILKIMPKAFYSMSDLGHACLVLKKYAQVTSPIRRGGDFANNYLLDCLDAGIQPELTFDFLTKLSSQASRMEILSDKATRECDQMFQAQYMSNNIGMTFNGRIMDVNPSGLMVKTDNVVYGKVNLGNIQIGKYSYNKATGALISKHSDERLCLGDSVKILVRDANIHNGTVDYDLIEKLDQKKLKLKK